MAQQTYDRRSFSSKSIHELYQRFGEFETRDAEEGADTARELELARRGGAEPPRPDSTREEGDMYLVSWDPDNPQENPRNWPLSKKARVMAIISFFSLMGPYSSSMVSPALNSIAKDLHTPNQTEETLLVSIFVLAYMFGPLFSSPISESVGRRPVLFTCNALFTFFNLGCAWTKNSAQMIVLRFIAGFFAGSVLPMGGGTIADLFEPSKRGFSMSLYALTPLFGPSVGPVVSGWIIQSWGRDKWPWIFWTSSLFSAAVEIAGVIGIPETYAPQLLRRKARNLRKSTGNEKLHSAFDTGTETLAQKAKRVLLRPLIFLTTELVVFLPGLYMAIIYGCFYLLIATLPMVFEEEYGMPTGIASLHNLALSAGVTAGSFTLGPTTDYTYTRLCEKHGKAQPEYKLPILMVAVFFIPAGLLLYGWTSEYQKLWIAPDIGLFIVAAGMLGVFLQIQMYMVDVMSIYGSSAVSAVITLRSLLGFAFPLFARDMFVKLGFGWGVRIIC